MIYSFGIRKSSVDLVAGIVTLLLNSRIKSSSLEEQMNFRKILTMAKSSSTIFVRFKDSY